MLAIDEELVQPGPVALLFVLGLGVALVFLLFSLNKQLKRINFEERDRPGRREGRGRAQGEQRGGGPGGSGGGPAGGAREDPGSSDGSAREDPGSSREVPGGSAGEPDRRPNGS